MIAPDLKARMVASVTRDWKVEPAHWSTIGPDSAAAYLCNIPLVGVYNVKPVEEGRTQREPVGWHTYTRAPQKDSGRQWPKHGPFPSKAAADAMALATIRMFLICAGADLRIDWVHEWRDGGDIFGDWHGYAHGFEIAHIIHCRGGGKDYQKSRMWRGWFGAGIFGGEKDIEPDLVLTEIMENAKELVQAMWVRWLQIAEIVFDWPDPFFEPPATRVWGELHREKYWRGQMLMEGDGI